MNVNHSFSQISHAVFLKVKVKNISVIFLSFGINDLI